MMMPPRRATPFLIFTPRRLFIFESRSADAAATAATPLMRHSFYAAIAATPIDMRHADISMPPPRLRQMLSSFAYADMPFRLRHAIIAI